LQGANYYSITDSAHIKNDQNIVLGVYLGVIKNFLYSDAYFSFNLGYGLDFTDGLNNYGDTFNQKEKFLSLSIFHYWNTDYRQVFFRYKFYACHTKHFNTNSILEIGNEMNANNYILWKRNNCFFRLDLDLYRMYLKRRNNLSLSPKIILSHYNDFNHKNYVYEVGLGIDLFANYYSNIVDFYISRKFGKEEFNSFTEINFTINIVNFLKEFRINDLRKN
jgi:hypothetical protein